MQETNIIVYVQDFVNYVEQILFRKYGFNSEINYVKANKYFRVSFIIDDEVIPLCIIDSLNGEVFRTNDLIHPIGKSLGNIFYKNYTFVKRLGGFN